MKHALLAGLMAAFALQGSAQIINLSISGHVLNSIGAPPAIFADGATYNGVYTYDLGKGTHFGADNNGDWKEPGSFVIHFNSGDFSIDGTKLGITHLDLGSPLHFGEELEAISVDGKVSAQLSVEGGDAGTFPTLGLPQDSAPIYVELAFSETFSPLGGPAEYITFLSVDKYSFLPDVPSGSGAVPEPSTYGIFGAVVLLGAITLRRRMSRN